MKKTPSRRTPPILYTVNPKDLAGHLFEVTLRVEAPTPDGQVLALPAWIPGSYMIREFARNIVQIRAEANGQPVALDKLDKHTWRAAPVQGALTVVYEVYAWDMSVRAAHMDQTHAFFNGTSLYLRVEGQENLPHQVELLQPQDPAARYWRVATALPELGAKRYGFGTYAAADYDELIDHPVEMGDFALGSFTAYGVEHDIVITGRVPNLDMERLERDLKVLCERHIAFFEPKTKRAPMDRYVFMTMAVGDSYGGLEHRASTALVCNRADLPTIADQGGAPGDGYIKYLGLCSHEYFHTWNVKRMKPAEFAPYDLRVENYSRLLWLFEGFTSYYDDLLLLRSGLIDEPAYMKLLGKTIASVLRGSGRTKQSVAESSFDAWTKYYRQDENAPNSIVSYYTKGSLIALVFDLTIRAKTGGARSLDDVMVAIWQRYGRDFYPDGGRGISEAEVEAIFDEVTGLRLKPLFDRYVRGTDELPLARLYAGFGVRVIDERKPGRPSLDVSTAREGADVKFTHVLEGGAAHAAGISAGDILIAIDGLRVGGNLDAMLARYAVGDAVSVHVFRRDELMAFSVTLQGERAPRITLTLADNKKPTSLRRPSALR